MDSEKALEIIRGSIEVNPFVKALKIEVTEAGDGYLKGFMPMTDSVCNLYGGVHGGALFALADTIGGYAAFTYGKMITTQSGQLNYLRPAVNTGRIWCEARVMHQGKRTGVYETMLTNDAGELIAMGTFNAFVLDKKAE